jgi:hypothetical protein
MMNSSIRSEDRLEGSSNFNNWKARIIAILEEHDLDQYVLMEIAEPTSAAGKIVHHYEADPTSSPVFITDPQVG